MCKEALVEKTFVFLQVCLTLRDIVSVVKREVISC